MSFVNFFFHYLVQASYETRTHESLLLMAHWTYILYHNKYKITKTNFPFRTNKIICVVP